MIFSTLFKNAGRVSALCLTVYFLAALGTARQTPNNISETLRIPDGQALLFTARAKGVQIYESRKKADDPKSFEWVFKAPEADLFDSDGKRIGKHYAGPKWESNDGSIVVGKKSASVPGVRPNDIPWLLLNTASTTGSGIMNRVSYILRVDTVGGTAPLHPPNAAGKRATIKYSATYVFFEAAGAPQIGSLLVNIVAGAGPLQSFHDLQYDDSGPAWSPDGKKIALVRSLGMNYDIFVINADGSALTNITNNAALFESQPAWSPDGKKLVFSSDRDAFYHAEIYVMNADGSNPTRLTKLSSREREMRNDCPIWTPNGKQIAFVSTRDGNAEIYVMNADGTAQTNLTNNGASDIDPVWSPDGKRIAFLSGRDGNPDLYVMNADGSGVLNVTNNKERNHHASWSPDGKKLSFISLGESWNEIHIVNADGSALTRITNLRGNVGEASWSPNGKRILFRSDNHIEVMNSDGSERRVVSDDDAMRAASQVATRNGPLDFHPAWSPDGKKIAYSTFWDGERDVYVMNADGGKVKNLTNYAASAVLLAPAPPVRSLVGHTGPVHSVSFASDGKTVASCGEDGTIRIWNIATGHEDKLLKLERLVSPMNAVAFAPNGLSLVSGDANGNLLRWDVSTGKPDHEPLISTGTNRAIKQIVCSPDGEKVAVVTTKFDRGDPAGDRVTLRDAKTFREEVCLTDGYRTDLGLGWPTCSIAFAPDSTRVTVAYSGRIDSLSFFDVWDPKSGKKLLSFGADMLKGDCLSAFSADGESAVLACDDTLFGVDMSRILRIGRWEVRPGTYWFGAVPPRYALWGAPDNKVTSLVCSPDGRTVATCGGTKKKEHSGRRVRLWDAATGKLKMEIPDVGCQINGLALSRDGHILAGACEDGTVKLWDTSSLLHDSLIPMNAG